jgi:hypothetical protein
MSIAAYEEEQTRLKIKKELLRIQTEKADGDFEYISYDEFKERMDTKSFVAENLDNVKAYE